MSNLNKFLSLNLTQDNDSILDSFIKAIYEIRAEELGVSISDLEINNDKIAIKTIEEFSLQPICWHTDTVKMQDNIPNHAKSIVSYCNSNNHFPVFRGTRLPVPTSSFQNKRIHTTPLFSISAAYAIGVSNGYSGIGRILNSENFIGFGFIHVYAAELKEKIYKNFGFENSHNDELRPKKLEDLKNEIKKFSELKNESFSIEYFSENQLYGTHKNPIKMSENMKKWYDFISSTKCLDTPYYEVLLSEKTIPKYTFLINNKNQILQLNLSNPKIKKALNHLQNILLKDFYEVLPLEKLIEQIDLNISKVKEIDSNNNQIIELLKKENFYLEKIKKSIEYKIKKIRESPIFDINLINENLKQVGATNMIGEPTFNNTLGYPENIRELIKKYEDQIKIVVQYTKTKIISLHKKEIFKENNTSNILLNELISKCEIHLNKNNSLVKKIDNNSAISDFIYSLEKRFNIPHKKEPDIQHFVFCLKELKEENNLRKFLAKKELTEIYSPMISFSLNLLDKINTKENTIGTITAKIDEIREQNFRITTRNCRI